MRKFWENEKKMGDKNGGNRYESSIFVLAYSLQFVSQLPPATYLPTLPVASPLSVKVCPVAQHNHVGVLISLSQML